MKGKIVNTIGMFGSEHWDKQNGHLIGKIGELELHEKNVDYPYRLIIGKLCLDLARSNIEIID